MHRDLEPLRGAGVSRDGHAGWVGERLAGADLLQVGGPERASRLWRVRGGRLSRRVLRIAAGLFTAACAGIGIALLLAPANVTVSMTASTYRIGDSVLHAVAPGVYSGDGALVISRRGEEVIAAGSAVVDGMLWVAVCEVDHTGSSEICDLHRGATSVTALDAWSEGRWLRTYSDGSAVVINAGRGVSVPFPVGR